MNTKKEIKDFMKEHNVVSFLKENMYRFIEDGGERDKFEATLEYLKRLS